MAINEYSKNDKTAISKDFKVLEFACHGSGCCSTVKIDSKLIEYLQKIRDHFDKPVIVSSGYRCAKHNKAVGGATGSYHAKGRAADIMVKDVTPAEVAKYAESISIKGIGLYETNSDGHFVHIDTRTTKSFWYGQKQKYRSTFGGAPIVKVNTPNNKIEQWQKAAIADGYKFPVYGADGSWGPECVYVAKKAFVEKNTPYNNENLTKFVQKALGFTGGAVDGKCGVNTQEKIKEYQHANGLTPDGVVGLNTWKKLLGVR